MMRIIKDYGKIGSVLVVLGWQWTRLSKCTDNGEIFYILKVINPFSRLPVIATKISLDMANKLITVLSTDKDTTEIDGGPKKEFSPILGFSGEIIKDYGKIGDTTRLFRLSKKGKEFFALTTENSNGLAFISIKITQDMAEKLASAFRDNSGV